MTTNLYKVLQVAFCYDYKVLQVAFCYDYSATVPAVFTGTLVKFPHNCSRLDVVCNKSSTQVTVCQMSQSNESVYDCVIVQD